MKSSKFVLDNVDAEKIFSEMKTEFDKYTSWEKEMLYHKGDTNEFMVIVFEQFFFRSNSSASVTYTFIREGAKIDAFIVASGAGAGILNNSLGALSKMIKDARGRLLAIGFKEV